VSRYWNFQIIFSIGLLCLGLDILCQMVQVLQPGQRQADVTSVRVCVCVFFCGRERERAKNGKRVDVIRAVSIKLFHFVVSVC